MSDIGPALNSVPGIGSKSLSGITQILSSSLGKSLSVQSATLNYLRPT